MSYRELVQRFGVKSERLAAMEALVGTSLGATALRKVQLAPEAYDALVEGLRDPNPAVRYNCVSLLDHVPNAEALFAVVPLLDDPVPRVRRIAVHTLACIACKPTAEINLPSELLAKVAEMAESDPSEKVRNEARITLYCRT